MGRKTIYALVSDPSAVPELKAGILPVRK